jgi:pyruvate dehydrogenase E2 component (dihydrolipoamide acetyltransferase)
MAVDMTDVIRIRKDLRASINDFIIAAAARSLREHPWVNSHWAEERGVEQQAINIAIAVATERGLYNPVLHHCERLTLGEISRRAAGLVERAHGGRLTPEELEGGTFTISNMGMLGVESFTAIITPPQAAVLAVGTVRGEAVVDEKGEPGVAPVVRLTLGADHRILDGADAAEFLATLKSYLEAPVTLVTCDYGKE